VDIPASRKKINTDPDYLFMDQDTEQPEDDDTEDWLNETSTDILKSKPDETEEQLSANLDSLTLKRKTNKIF
jgi:hypothetical protein